MTIKDMWNLFKMTGKIEYYLKYKEMVVNGDKESNRDNS